ncbi:hypothetical protein [Lactiplantibacillus daowaiensis]|uniref:Uncharacterized protein n=1 Tax=Lactiplantibacillus daowaiensis TaxID=2559918 RepID=A0ABW1RZR7_9LACO|nr:hypothetical protein [Lactiplantibacillus daowaiensis]
MKRITKLLLIVFGTVLLVGGTGVTAQTSQAATHKTAKKVKWHKGTPKAVRGYYETKPDAAGLASQYKIRARSVWYWHSGMPDITSSHVYYRSLGHHRYVIRYNAHWYGGRGGQKNYELDVHKIGKKLKVSSDKQLFSPVKTH